MNLLFVLLFFSANLALFYFNPLKYWQYILSFFAMFIILTIVLYIFPNLYYLHFRFVMQIVMSFMILISTNIARILCELVVDRVVNFHLQNNNENLNRNPIKFLVKNAVKIKKGYIIGLLVLSLIMLLGNWFGQQN
ncbi:hypothetical protein [Soonwooa sp.]|uniref:hypothetical protein n=1 Tax=Soonwooa sp. TaxID=1938592 RepID=UPI00260C4024|nr:hypothetical protein [Soonwooa sp.]